MAVSRVHTSDKAQESPLIQSRLIKYHKQHLNPLDPDFILDQHQIVLTHIYQPSEHATFFPENMNEKMLTPYLSVVKKVRKKLLDLSLFSDSPQKFTKSIIGWDSSFMQVFLKSVKQPTNGHWPKQYLVGRGYNYGLQLHWQTISLGTPNSSEYTGTPISLIWGRFLRFTFAYLSDVR